ncbi:MAG: hypothetical protein LQ343_001663 [Gyalolechia ehrenbergii]|nr:MAG: hypothetical protein LQ343_001663 [Gyalolechia ehrenbergii]
MAIKKKRKKPHLLSHTRPPIASQRPSLSSQATRSLIRKHHNLQKQLHSAVSNGDAIAAEGIQAQLAASGGLQKYQEASIQGQSAERGGDTSKMLMEWMDELLSPTYKHDAMVSKNVKILEVGALKVDNACSRSGIFDVTRIDLRSQHPEIRTQDFMAMPTPSQSALEKDGFDIVSLSLVVNYIGDAVGRGEMLKRVASFLRFPKPLYQNDGTRELIFPALFLVLPAPCVTNSRYLDEDRLEAIMKSLGYVKSRGKISRKLVYYLWRRESVRAWREEDMLFKKQEVRSGSQRNNFTIVLQ